ncbi:MAG: hypothetical protein EPN40_11570 [Rhodanobacteraceae bacterium]|nr:MAG: hypothetical protein EPN40_11570 [Rhodanobacteraceae bacterium]
MNKRQDRRAFGPLVEECRVRGIGRTVAFELARNCTIETFHLGRRVFVMLDSLDSLPERLTTRERESA